MTARRLRAPATDGGILVDPPPGAVGDQIAANAARLADWDYDFQGRRVSRLRSQTRREVLSLAREFLRRYGLGGPPLESEASGQPPIPLIVTGHQPELFHPGVWVKNFAASAIAASHGGLALNLIVDNDIPKSTSISVPTIDGELVRGVGIDFDRWQGESPYEDLKVRDEHTFATFAERVRPVLGRAVEDPVLDEFWPRVVARRAETDSLGLRFSLARRELEAAWGVRNLEIPLGQVCQTDGFLWFASHILAQLPRYRDVHNSALAEYRATHGIRSKNHPVAALAREGDWLEAPFWVWRAGVGQPRRRALMTRRRDRVLDLRIAGEDRGFLELPLTPEGEACCAVERLRELPSRSIRLRTRALTTTMFSRFLLGDLFIHGIGGAKYDELGDEISRRFFGIEPPRFLALSMTLWLGLTSEPATPHDLRSIDRRLRDLRFNPDRFLPEPNSDEVRRLIRGKREAIAGPLTSHRDRYARRTTIRRFNDALQPWVQDLKSELLGHREKIRRLLRSKRVTRNREFSFVLHSSRRLRESLLSVGEALGS